MRGRNALRRETCDLCANFLDGRTLRERGFPGTLALSLVRGSVPHRCGLCRRSGTFQDPLPACSGFRFRLHHHDGDAAE